MIDIEKVRFKNFLCFGSRWQEVEFYNGINIVLGYDKDRDKSNGSGKSSFLETIPFALFGQIHKEVKKDEIVNWKNRKACEVQLTFTKGDKQYLVVRGIKPNKLEIYENGVLLPKPAHVRDYQAELEAILGSNLNYPTFMSLVHSNLNSSKSILNMKKAEKRKFLENVFGLGLYSFLNDKANEKKRLANEKIRESKLSMDHNNRTIDEKERRITDLERKLGQTSMAEIQHREYSEKLESLNDRLDGLEDELDEIRSDITAWESLSAQKEILYQSVRGKVSSITKYKHDTIQKEIKRIKDIEEQMPEIIKAKEDLSKLRNRNELDKKYDDLSEKLSGLRQTLSESRGELSGYLKEIKEKESMIKDDICPTCGQKIEKTCNVENIKIEIENTKNSVEILRKEISKIQDDIKILDDELRRIKKDRYEHDRLSKIVDSAPNDIGDKVKAEKDFKRYKSTLMKLTSFKDKVYKEIGYLKNLLNVRYERKEEIITQLKRKSEVEEKIKQCEITLKAEEKAKKEFQTIIDQEKDSIKGLQSEIRKADKEKNKFTNMLDYLEAIKVICKDENIKQYAISSMMPYLNRKVNEYLSEVGYGFYVVFDKWLDATIKGPGITNGSYGSLSGGESRGIDLALQFAILDIVRIQAGDWPNILVMDEILDSSVDGKGINKILGIIDVKQQEDDNKIFIISHREELDDSVVIDNTYRVEKENGFSKVIL